MIAYAVGAQVVAVDIDDAKLDFARSIGAQVTINSKNVDDVVAAVKRQAPGTWLPLKVKRGSEMIEIIAKFPAAER